MSQDKDVKELSAYATKNKVDLLKEIADLAEQGKTSAQIRGYLAFTYDDLKPTDISLLMNESGVGRQVMRGFRASLYEELVKNPVMTKEELEQFLNDSELASASDRKHTGHWQGIRELVASAVKAAKK